MKNVPIANWTTVKKFNHDECKDQHNVHNDKFAAMLSFFC